MTTAQPDKGIRCSACGVEFATFTLLKEHVQQVRGTDKAHPLPRSTR